MSRFLPLPGRLRRRRLMLHAFIASTVAAAVCPAAPGQCELAKLGSDGADHDKFGVSVAMSGDTILVGALKYDAGADDTGAAFVFERDGSDWVRVATLVASDAAVEDHFGGGVAVDGNYAVVSSLDDDDAGVSSGSAYVFERQGQSWVEMAKLTPSDAQLRHYFGSAVAIQGNLIVVGAWADQEGGPSSPSIIVPDSGAAYVFELQGDQWVEIAKLIASDAAIDDLLGGAAAISGDLIAVGAHRDDTAGINAGSVYIFRRENDGWVQEAEVTGFGGGFATALDLSGDTLLVGAYYHGFNNPGAAWVFRRDNGTWTEEAMLTSSDSYANDEFGISVGLDGDTALVGAWHAGNGWSGKTYLFRRSGVEWTETAILVGSDLGSHDQFGVSVAAEGNLAVLGAYEADNPETEQGAVYVYAIGPDSNGNGIPDECDPCPWDLDGDGGVSVNDFLDLLTAWGTNPGGPPDFDGNGDVDVIDFLALLGAWGPCPLP